MDPDSPFNTKSVIGNKTLLKQSFKNQISYFSMLPSISSIYKKEYNQKFMTKDTSKESFVENLLRVNPENEKNLFRDYQDMLTTTLFFDKLSSNRENANRQHIKKWRFVRKVRTIPSTRSEITKSKSICRQVSRFLKQTNHSLAILF